MSKQAKWADIAEAIPGIRLGIGTVTDICQFCPHVRGEHILEAQGDPLAGGTFFCPEEGCACTGTWDVPQLATRGL